METTRENWGRDAVLGQYFQQAPYCITNGIRKKAINCLCLTFTATKVQSDHWGWHAVPVELWDKWRMKSLRR